MDQRQLAAGISFGMVDKIIGQLNRIRVHIIVVPVPRAKTASLERNDPHFDLCQYRLIGVNI